MPDHEINRRPIKFKELHRFEEFQECISLQKKIFGVSDFDIISPVMINVFARKIPPIGIVIGAQDTNNGQLIGFVFTTSVLQEDALYIILVGVHPGYQNQDVGYGLLNYLKEVALSMSIKQLYCLFDPLESNLGNFYIKKMDFQGIQYKESVYQLSHEKDEIKIPIDKLVAKCKLDPLKTKTPGKSNKPTLTIEIPGNFLELKTTDPAAALEWRLNTREQFTKYLNNEGFRITGFHKEKSISKHRYYYLLEKKTFSY